MSIFDANGFLDATITEVQVKRPPLPAGSEWIATMGTPKIRPWQGKADPSKTGIAADVPMVIDTSPGVANGSLSADYPPAVTITYGIMLDTTAAGSIDLAPGRNTKLRQFREALGMNAPGSPFNWRAVEGRQVRVKISHRSFENELYDDTAAVAKV